MRWIMKTLLLNTTETKKYVDRQQAELKSMSTGSGEHIALIEVDSLPHDVGHDAQEVPRGGQRVPVPDGTQVPSGAQQMPESFTIGTKNAFKGN